MHSKFLLLSAALTMMSTGCFSQNVYGIAPIERQDITCPALEARNEYPDIPVYETKESETIVAVTVDNDKKRKKKRKKKKVKTEYVKKATVAAVETDICYDPNEVLHNGFTLTLWALPQVTLVERHGYVLYPLDGSKTNGIMQSQWGVTIDKQYIRVYERYHDERLLLEYRHDCKGYIFVALVCTDNTPALYVNGRHVATGLRSAYFPHPAFEGDAQCPPQKRFVGEHSGLHYFRLALTSYEVLGLYENESARSRTTGATAQ